MLLSVLTVIPSAHAELSAVAGSLSAAVQTDPQGGSSEFFTSDVAIVASLLLGAVAGAGLPLFWLRRRRSGSQRVGVPRSIVPSAAKKNDRTGAAESMSWTPLEQSTTIVEELNCVEEEAEVFLMLGRMDMAIGVLRHYIESHDDAQPQVWMALLDILHNEGLRGEFEKLALEIKAHFNVALPSWENANERSSGLSALEHFPHLLARIYKQWNRPDCLGYLRSLIHDNRDGGRSGFHQEVFRELLLLVSIQEYRSRFAD